MLNGKTEARSSIVSGAPLGAAGEQAADFKPRGYASKQEEIGFVLSQDDVPGMQPLGAQQLGAPPQAPFFFSRSGSGLSTYRGRFQT